MANGGPREGSGRKPGVNMTLSMKTMIEDLREYHPTARARLMQLIASQDPEIALRALELFYNRGYGKPKEEINLIGADTHVRETVHLKIYELKKALELADLPFSHLVSRDMKLIEETPVAEKVNGEAEEVEVQ